MSRPDTIEAKGFLANLLLTCCRALATAWWWLRQVTGDAAYDNYLLHHLHSPTLTRTQFYRDSLRRKYSTINRCC